MDFAQDLINMQLKCLSSKQGIPSSNLGSATVGSKSGSLYIGQGSTIRFGGSWISFLDSLLFSVLIVWTDSINKCS